MERGTIRNVAVLGLGTMGHGIAQTMAAAGCSVRGYDVLSEARESLHDRISANLHESLAVGLIEKPRIDEAVERITVCETEEEALAGAQFVTEAVAEDLTLKQQLFARIESHVPHSAILASNTSSYPISEIATRMSRPDRAVVTHWFNPPHIVPVVEVVPGKRTSDETVDAACGLLERIGKTPVRLNQEIPGFLVNRIQVAMFREVLDLLDRDIATAAEIDRAIKGSMGLRLAALGPLAIIDFAGLDVTSRVYRNLVPHLRCDHELPQRIGELVEAGHYGVKSGRGVFSYPAESVNQRVAARDRLYSKLVELVGREGETGAPDGDTRGEGKSDSGKDAS